MRIKNATCSSIIGIAQNEPNFLVAAHKRGKKMPLAVQSAGSRKTNPIFW
jgi:hypothetical protein